MDNGEAGLPEERVRHALATPRNRRRLGADVPARITARIGAALRAAPPAHAAIAPQLAASRLRIIGMIIGIGAAAAVASVYTAMLVHSSSAAPRIPRRPNRRDASRYRCPARLPTRPKPWSRLRSAGQATMWEHPGLPLVFEFPAGRKARMTSHPTVHDVIIIGPEPMMITS